MKIELTDDQSMWEVIYYLQDRNLLTVGDLYKTTGAPKEYFIVTIEMEQ